MTAQELKEKLYHFTRERYPDINIEVVETADNIRQLYFTTEKFGLLYPKQRYHYLMNLIPPDFYEKYLQHTEWYELAPNEQANDLDYHDQDTIEAIREAVISLLKRKAGFVSLLDEAFTSHKVQCHGDFRHSKNILKTLQFSEEDQFDIFHVLMDEGGYCDCEILFNVFRDSEHAKSYFSVR